MLLFAESDHPRFGRSFEAGVGGGGLYYWFAAYSARLNGKRSVSHVEVYNHEPHPRFALLLREETESGIAVGNQHGGDKYYALQDKEVNPPINVLFSR